MKKDFGVKPWLYPMPTYMIGTYNEDDTVDVMMMAWGGICAEDMVALNLEEDHKTVLNLQARRAFTLAVPGTDTIRESDYLGTASAKKFPDKFAKTGLHAEKSSRVDAPVITEYPLTLECEVVEMQQQPYGLRVWRRHGQYPPVRLRPSCTVFTTSASGLSVTFMIVLSRGTRRPSRVRGAAWSREARAA